MPTYDYQCRSCGSVTEVIHSMLEAGPSACERCGGELRRVLYPAGIIFKGSGFYRTDSRNGDSASKSASTTTESGGSSGSEKSTSSSSEGSKSGGASTTKAESSST